MIGKICSKCQTEDIEISIRNTTWCKGCFREQVHHKFYQGLKIAKEYCRPPKGSKKTRDEYGSLVIHFDHHQPLPSLVLLHLLKRYLQNNQDRSTAKWESPTEFRTIRVITIDYGSGSDFIKTSNAEEMSLEEVKKTVEELGFQYLVLQLDDLYRQHIRSSGEAEKCYLDLSQSNYGTKQSMCSPSLIEETDQTPLQQALLPLSRTSRVCLINQLISSILIKACATGRQVLLKPTNSTQMAIDTLLGVSLGAGWNLNQQVGPSSQVEDILICRPLSQIVNAELVHYAKLFQTPVKPKLLNLNKKEDIPSLISDFVIRLEEDYPMTSSVINQTANKIGQNNQEKTTENLSLTDKKCIMCHLYLDPQASQWKRSITLNSHVDHAIQPDLKQSDLCYACLGMYADRKEPTDRIRLPTYCLKESIQEFLIDDS